MSEPVTWQALVFLAGIIVGTVGWTWWFWTVVASKADLKELERRFEEHIKDHG